MMMILLLLMMMMMMMMMMKCFNQQLVKNLNFMRPMSLKLALKQVSKQKIFFRSTDCMIDRSMEPKHQSNQPPVQT